MTGIGAAASGAFANAFTQTGSSLGSVGSAPVQHYYYCYGLVSGSNISSLTIGWVGGLIDALTILAQGLFQLATHPPLHMIVCFAVSRVPALAFKSDILPEPLRDPGNFARAAACFPAVFPIRFSNPLRVLFECFLAPRPFC